MSARLTPGGLGESGYFHLDLDIVVTMNEVEMIGKFLAEAGFHDVTDMLADMAEA